MEAEFEARRLEGTSLALAVENGRYLDEFRDLMAVHLTVTGQNGANHPVAAFNTKGFGRHWEHTVSSLDPGEWNRPHRLKIHFDPASGPPDGFFDGRLLGTFNVDFRSSILKIRLSVFHDGRDDRTVDVEWKSFLLEYNEPAIRPEENSGGSISDVGGS